MIEFPNIMAIVLGVFLSPGLPEGTIVIGETTCQEAQAILQQHDLKLVDTEYLDTLQDRAQLKAEEPRQELAAVHTLSFERVKTGWDSGHRSSKKRSFFKETPRPQAGFILCGLFQEVVAKN